jgi:hypothetical protein
MIEPNLDSAVFNDATVEEVISRMLNRVAKRFKNDRKQAMATDSHTGRIYSRGGAPGLGVIIKPAPGDNRQPLTRLT